MKEDINLLALIKEIGEFEKDENWIEYFKEKYVDIIEKYKLNINFTRRNFPNKEKDDLNIMFEMDIKGLKYNASYRTRGYYIIILNAANKPKLLIGVGKQFFEIYYKLDKNKLDSIFYSTIKAPYTLAYEKLEKENVKFKYWKKEEYEKYLDLNTISNSELEEMLDELKKIIFQYPEVMQKYIDQQNIKEYETEFDKLKINNKENGRLFTLYLWSYLKNSEKLEPNFEKTNIKDNESSMKNNIEENDKSGVCQIIYGVPGSGKSYYLDNDILHIYDKNRVSNSQYERIIFHPEYSYYDFVGQKLPKEDGTGLEFYPGPFTRILEQALNKKSKPHYLIIEELNRGNCEAIFGDILQLLDRDEETKESVYKISNRDIEEYLIKKVEDFKEGERIYIPSNMSIYATINNSDQNVFNMDSAFGRRWEYKNQLCNPRKNKNIPSIYYKYIIGTSIKWNDFREAVNSKILDLREEIYNAEDKRIGMFYIDKKCLSNEPNFENKELKLKFASKMLKYLYNEVFKDESTRKEVFSRKYSCLEEFIYEWTEHESDFESILNIAIQKKEERNYNDR